jgi:hypothetical protein
MPVRFIYFRVPRPAAAAAAASRSLSPLSPSFFLATSDGILSGGKCTYGVYCIRGGGKAAVELSFAMWTKNCTKTFLTISDSFFISLGLCLFLSLFLLNSYFFH